MNKKIVLVPLSKKNEDGINLKQSNNPLFITVLGKKFIKDKESDILGLVVATTDCSKHMPPIVQSVSKHQGRTH